MYAKLFAATLMITSASTLGCGASPDSEHDEPADEAVTATAESALSPIDDRPAPFDRPVFRLQRPAPWDLRPYLEELRRPEREFGNCYRYYVTFEDPAIGRKDIPVTVCN